MYDTDEEKNQQYSFQICVLNGKGDGAQGELGGGDIPPSRSVPWISYPQEIWSMEHHFFFFFF